jgi:hypothetical protein
MKVKSSVTTSEHNVNTTHTFKTEGLPENGLRNFVIDVVAGTGTNQTSGKSITGRLHPALPLVTLATPATGTNPNYNSVVAMPHYEIYIQPFPGVGLNQIQRVYAY